MILLVADLQELKANPKRAGRSARSSRRSWTRAAAPVATALVQTGTLKVGDIIVVGETFGTRPRARERPAASAITKAGPSTRRRRPRACRTCRRPATSCASSPTRRPPATMVEARKAAAAAKGGEGSGRATLEDLYRQIQAGQAKELRIILKADVSGSLGRDHPRPRAARPGRGPDQRPPRGRRRHHRQRHHARVGVERDRRRVQHEDHRHRPPRRRGRGRRRPPLRHHLQADRRHRRRPSRACSSRRSSRSSRVARRSARSSGSARARSSPAASSPTGGSSAAAPASGAAARSSPPTGSSRSAASATTSARSPRTTSAASASPNYNDLEEGDIIECFTSQTVSRAAGRADAGGGTALSRPMSQRTERVDELLRQEIGAILRAGVADPRIGFATITRRRDDAGPAPRQGLGQRHRPAGRARRDDRGAAAARCRSSATSWASALRIKRIPELHVQLDDTAERGTRVLHLLDELEAGARPGRRSRRSARRCRRRSPRLPHEGDPRPRRSGRRSASAAAREPRRDAAGPAAPDVRPRPRPNRTARASADERSTSRPCLDAVPDAVVDAAARRPARARRQPREPRRRHARARRSAIVPARRGAAAARATAVCTDPVPPLYDFLPGVERVPDRSRTRRATTTCSSSRDCGSLDRIGDGRAPPRRAVRAAAAGRHRPPRLERRRRRGRLDRARQPPRPARWSRSSPPGSGVPLDAGDGALAAALMAGIVMDTATFAHPNATPRTLAVSAALVEAGAPLSDISRRLYRSKPDAQLRLFGRVLDRLETRGRRPDRPVDARSTPTSPRPARSPPHSEGIIDLLAQSEAAEVAILFKEAGRRATRISVRTKPGGVDATVLTGRVRRRRARPRGRGDGRAAAVAEARPAGPRRGRAARRRRRRADAWRASARPGWTASSSSPSRSGPTSHDVVGARPAAGRDEARRPRRDARPVRRAASCRCSWAGRRGSSSTTSAIASATARRSASARRRRPTTSRAS